MGLLVGSILMFKFNTGGLMKSTMVEWFKSEELSIFFSDIPRVCVRYIIPSTTEDEAKSIKRYPFMNKKEITVALFDHKKKKSYKFAIPKGYCYDGATINRFFWRIIGSKTDNTFMIAALIHDVLCENHHYIDNDRELSSKVFRDLLLTGGVGRFKAQIMYIAKWKEAGLCKKEVDVR